MRRVLLLIIVATMLPLLFAQSGDSDEHSLIARARRGDDSAISEMEKRGDVEDLNLLLHDPAYAQRGTIHLRLALARLGDRESLQYFACRSLTDDIDSMQLLLRDEFDHIGGAFTVEVYRRLFESDQRFMTFVNRSREGRYSDVVITLPSVQVLPYLSKLVPEAKISSPVYAEQATKDAPALKQQWRRWIETHKHEIYEKRPLPTGISFEEHFCKSFMAHQPPEN